MLLRRVAEHIKDQNWFAVAIDFLIVVIGVFVGLQVSNWNEAQTQAKREAFYISALHDDFKAIIQELEHDIARYESIANAMTLLIEQSRLALPDASLEELNEAVRYLISMEGTPIVSDTYSNLTGSGDLAIIQSQTVKAAVSSFFGQAEIVRLVGDTHEMQLVNIFQPYIISHLDYTSMFRPERGIQTSANTRSDQIISVLHTDEFRNVAAVKWDIATDIRGLLLTALEEARAVDALLVDEMDRSK